MSKNNEKPELLSRREAPEEELKRLCKENKSLKSDLDKTRDKLEQSNVKLNKTKAELKKTSRLQPCTKHRKNFFRCCSLTSLFTPGDQAMHTFGGNVVNSDDSVQ